MKPIKIAVCMGIALCCYSAMQAQGFLKKMKEKAEAAVNKVGGGNNGANNGNTDNSGNTNNPSGPGGSTGGKTYGKPSNKGGQGLVTTPPDVNENLTAAETSFKANSYGESRYAIQQAMLGVELKIGQNILKSLPLLKSTQKIR